MILLLLIPLLFSGASVLPAGAGAPRLGSEANLPLADLLTEGGSLDLSTGFSGTLDARGYRMVTDAGGEPHFVHDAGQTAGTTSGWDDRFALRGVNCCTVHVVVVDGTDVYIGGAFNNAGGIDSTSIVRWDGRRFWSLGGGVKNTANGQGVVNDIVVIDGDVYVAGRFVMAGNTPASGIARWDGNAWSPVGTGQGATVSNGQFPSEVFAAAAIGSTLYIGGEFTEVDGIPAASVARWNGTTWSAMGGGLTYHYGGNGPVRALESSGDLLYVGGHFNRAGAQAVNGIALWNETTDSWSPLGTGIAGGAGGIGDVRAIEVAPDTGDVYAGGRFTTAGGQPARNIARWNGTAWSALAGGVDAGELNTEVSALELREDGLYVGGDFTAAGGVAARHLARWNGAAWSQVGEGTSDPVRDLDASAEGLYVGGWFSTASDLALNYVARWDDGWFTLGQGVSSGVQCCGRVEAVAVSAEGHVYIGGFFEYAGNVRARNIAMWDGGQWHALGAGTSGTVYALAIDGDELYVGGSFESAGNVNAASLAVWNRATQSWSSFGNGTNDNVYALLVHGPYVYVGGSFTSAGGTNLDLIARWNRDTQSWSGLGDRLFFAGPGNVRAIARDGDTFVIGGRFGYVYLDDGTTPIEVNSVLLWDSVADEWGAFDGGLTSYGAAANVHDLALVGDALYAGGDFNRAGGVLAPGVAKWDNSGWSALGAGIDGPLPEVYALASRGDTLYVGGYFETAGAVEASHIAQWNHATSQWAPLDEGIGGNPMITMPRVLDFDTSGGNLYTGGEFVTAGGLPSHLFARWTAEGPAAEATILPAQGGTLAAQGLTVQFPAGAVTEPVTVSYTPLSTLPHPVAPPLAGVRAWTLEARTPTGQLVTRFQQSYTMRVSYQESELAARGLDESSLQVVYWDGQAWVPMASTVDGASNRVTVVANHFTTFALVGTTASTGHEIYLPLVRR